MTTTTFLTSTVRRALLGAAVAGCVVPMVLSTASAQTATTKFNGGCG